MNVVAGVLLNDGQVLICQRDDESDFPLKWEFPGGKVTSNEDPETALRRELVEELAIDVIPEEKMLEYTYQYPDDLSVHLQFYVIREFIPSPINLQFNRIEWVPVDQLDDYDFLEGDWKAIEHLQGRFSNAD